VPDSKKVLLAAYGRLLKPLVRILIRNNVSFGDFEAVAKRTFVQVAADGDTGAPTASNSEIALRTGISQSEVHRLVAEQSSDDEESNLARITRLLTAWHSDPYFTGPYGLPLELSTNEDEPKSFAELVKRHGHGSPAHELLQQLKAVGAVREMDGWLRVLTRTFLPRVDAPEGLERLGQAVQFFVETIDFNRRETEPLNKLFERTVYADDGIKAEDLGRFRNYVRERAQLLTEDIDNWLSQLEKPDVQQGDVVINTGLGIYHYVEQTAKGGDKQNS